MVSPYLKGGIKRVKRLRGITFVLMGIVLLAGTAFAMPPRPGLGKADPTHAIPGMECPNMKKVKIVTGEDGRKLSFAILTQGTKKFPVLLIDYTDRTFTYDKSVFQTELFDGPFPSGTMKDYYSEISYNNLTVDGTCYGWFHAANNHSYYANNEYGINPASYPKNAAKLVEEAIADAEADGVNFAPFDNDGDGYVDCLIVAHSGEGAEGSGSTNDIWSHSATLTQTWGRQAYSTNDGVKIDSYIIQPELSSLHQNQMIEIGVFCHELGHALGLPDLYDTTPPLDPDSYGIGNYCLMSAGAWGANGKSPERPAHLCAWGKKFMGWLDPQPIEFDVLGLNIDQIETNPIAYRIGVRGFADTVEYFLIANREPVGFDSLFLTGGLLIWHIDEEKIAEGLANNQVNGDVNHKGVDLEEADGNADLDRKVNAGDAGDFFPGSTGKRYFTPYSIPNSDGYSGPSDIAITNISDAGTTMTFDMIRGEPYEPNDTFAQAYGPLNPPGLTYQAYIQNSSDLDYYKFNAQSGDTINIFLQDIPQGKDYDLWLYNSSRVLVDSSTTHYPSNAFENLTHIADSTQTYYLLVKGYTFNDYSSSYFYSLTATFKDITPPDLRLSLLQNPYLTRYLNLWLISADEPLESIPSLKVNLAGVETNVVLSEIASQSYFGDYRFSGSGIGIIIGSATDSSGNDTTVVDSLLVQLISGYEGGAIVSPDRRTSLKILAYSFPSEMYFTLFSVSSSNGRGNLFSQSKLKDRFAISRPYSYGPSGFYLSQPATLVFNYSESELGGKSELKLGIYLLQDENWIRLGGLVDEEQNLIMTSIDQLGIYQLQLDPLGPDASTLPKTILLVQNYPNPFREQTQFNYNLPNLSKKSLDPLPVSLKVYNISGQLVRTLVESLQFPGYYTASWDGRNGEGKEVATGVYFYQLRAGNLIVTKKMVRLK